jgi:hypothetical protein
MSIKYRPLKQHRSRDNVKDTEMNFWFSTMYKRRRLWSDRGLCLCFKRGDNEVESLQETPPPSWIRIGWSIP